MPNVNFKRDLLVTQANAVADVNLGIPVVNATDFYLPLVFDSFTAPNLTITGCTLTASQTRINGTAGAFDNIRVGDIVVSTSTGTLTPMATVSRNCSTFTGLDYIVYPSTFTDTTLNVSVGDAVSGTGIPTNTFVDRIDYSSRRIILTNAATADGASVAITITPPVRVIAVRPSTATTNANQIELSTAVATAGTNSSVVIRPGVTEALAGVLKVTPVSSTTSGRVSFSVGVALQDGREAKGSNDGLNGVNITTAAYNQLGTFNFDADTFLSNARLPRPISA